MLNYSLRDSIKNSTMIGDPGLLEQKSIFHITYGSDGKYQLGVAVSAVSVLINNPDKHFVFHIFTDAYSAEYQRDLQAIAEKFSTTIVIYVVDATFFSTLPSTNVWSHAMYYRLLAYQHLSQSVDRVLYLDADVMCAGDLGVLSGFHFNDNIAAVVDDLPGTRARSLQRLGSLLNDTGHYFNSGVMLVNLRLWQQHDLTRQALEMLLSPQYSSIIKYPDQDVLNILLSGKLCYLERKYNTIYTLKSELKDRTHKVYQNVITDETVLVHYTGITKPWHAWADYSSREVFDRAWRASPWHSSALVPARSVMEMQKEYKHHFARRRYLSGIKALIRYRIKKKL